MARPPLTEEEKNARLILKLKNELSQVKKQQKITMANGVGIETLVEELQDFLREDPMRIFPVKFEPVPQIKVPLSKAYKDGHVESIGFNVGDWHIGERINPMEMNGMNEHNTQIAAGKINQIVEKFMRIFRRHELMYDIDEIFVQILGDMISGSIHKELVLTNDLLDLPAVTLSARLMIMVLLRLKTLGKPIRVTFVVGNHARTTDTLPAKVQAMTSLDWLAYQMVADYFVATGDTQVTCNVSLAQAAFINMKGHNVVIEHGYGFPKKNIAQIDSKMREVYDTPEVRKITGAIGKAVDFVIIGDKHDAACGVSYMINGGLPGANELGPSWRLGGIVCSQQMFGVSRRNMPTFLYNLTADVQEAKKVDNPFSKYVSEYMKVYRR